MLELAKKFEALYRGLQRAHGTYTITHADDAKKGKLAGRAITVMETPTIEKWRAHLAGEQGIGVVPINEKNQCRWGAVDVDEYREGLLEDIEAKTRAMALPVICIRTKSGGIHVTVFIKEDTDARIVRSKMMEVAAALGYAGVEVYPKQTQLASERDVGNWLNMPYFAGDETTRYAIYKGARLSAAQFIEMAEALSCTPEQFIAIKMATGEMFEDGPPCLQTLSTVKVAVGGRNDAMFAMGVYARMKYDEHWEAKLDEFNAAFFTPPLPSREIQMLAKSLNRKTYFYPCSKQPMLGYCNKISCSKREFGIGQEATEPSVAIGKLVKLCTEPPTWIIDVEGARFELETEELMSQAKFAKACMEKINQWPPAVKPNVWRQLIHDRLANVELIEAPQEASPEGRFLWHLEQFCVVSANARVREEMLLGKPFTDEGRHFFRSEDLMRYLNQHGFREVTARKAWSMLRERAGAKHTQFQLKGRCVQCWSIPEFPKQSENFEPHVGKTEF
ncbi:MAG: hypothetical protein A2W25_16455 [candidate division Zixibacteria bacterium RBG_16_53_22]|nr:MAG: hypothetical protein A2W25_16455 [candidate division Zixibacteria bacterium RBG_16_53_22]